MTSPAKYDTLEAFLAGEALSLSDPPERLQRALTHRSYSFENDLTTDNERLEFLGDAVIGLLVSEALFARPGGADEGALSKARAALVNRKALGRAARELQLGQHLRLGRGEEQEGGRDRLSTLGCALEAVVGAIYLERGLDACRRFVEAFLVPNEDDWVERATSADFEAKSRLQERLQQSSQPLPRYEIVGEDGPDHAKRFVVEVYIGDTMAGRGEGPRKKAAENAAARAALDALEAAEAGDAK
jgi:ribonuclease-3